MRIVLAILFVLLFSKTASAAESTTSVSVHPLSAMQTWWGGSLTIAPPKMKHHALILSPSFTHDTGVGIGGEAGWFFYTGRPSTTGLWAGPSFVARPTGQDAHVYGVVVDAGVQVATKNGMNLSVGYGVQYLAYRDEPKIMPRLIVSLSF